jgi:hypothetical protein
LRRHRLLQVQPGGLEQLLVFDIPEILIRSPGNIGDDLAQPPMGIAPTQFSDRLQ